MKRMMTKKVAVLLCICCLVVAALILWAYIPAKSDDMIESPKVTNVDVVIGNDFDVDEYKEDIERYASNISVSAVDTPEQAAAAAIRIWNEYFTGVMAEFDAVIVCKDANNDYWHIYGQLPPPPPVIAGGEPHIIIHSNGSVSAIWHTQ